VFKVTDRGRLRAGADGLSSRQKAATGCREPEQSSDGQRNESLEFCTVEHRRSPRFVGFPDERT
jgi:hypothetical protein